ncbi:MAG TPA: hypothetical protein PLN69_06425 [bacterium]|nr:hypothetical protein [bacterium]
MAVEVPTSVYSIPPNMLNGSVPSSREMLPPETQRVPSQAQQPPETTQTPRVRIAPATNRVDFQG